MYKRVNKRLNKTESLTYEFLNSINFFTRYEKLCKDHYYPPLTSMDNGDVKKMVEIVKNNGYPKAKKSSSRTIAYMENTDGGENNFAFYIGFLNIGKCEFQMYFYSKEGEYILGDVCAGLDQLRYMVEDDYFEWKTVGYPKFKTYEEFEEIFIEFAKIYEDFKKAVIESGIRTKGDIEDIIE
ncbi:MAG: hypothetical protein ACRCXZ_08235 [Patescibacteria group bacterium]